MKLFRRIVLSIVLFFCFSLPSFAYEYVREFWETLQVTFSCKPTEEKKDSAIVLYCTTDGFLYEATGYSTHLPKPDDLDYYSLDELYIEFIDEFVNTRSLETVADSEFYMDGYRGRQIKTYGLSSHDNHQLGTHRFFYVNGKMFILGVTRVRRNQ